MQVRGFAIEFIEVLSKIKEMLSCPELYLGLRFLMMVFVSSSSIGVNLNTVLSLLMFKYDVKSGFPTGSSSFASFGPIFMKKLFNFSAISFLSVICFSLILK